MFLFFQFIHFQTAFKLYDFVSFTIQELQRSIHVEPNTYINIFYKQFFTIVNELIEKCIIISVRIGNF